MNGKLRGYLVGDAVTVGFGDGSLSSLKITIDAEGGLFLSEDCCLSDKRGMVLCKMTFSKDSKLND